MSYLGLLPFFACFSIFILVPMIQGMAMSFTNWSMRSRDTLRFIGLENYRYIIFSDGLSAVNFRASIRNLVVYVLITVPAGLTLALILALAVNQFTKWYAFFRGAFFIPTALPLFLATGIWMWFMSADVGLIASVLAKIGIGRGIIWRNTSGYAIVLCVIVDVWHAVGFNLVILSTGMRNISKEYYEAAEIDGASVFQKMRYVTIPLLEPVLFLVTVNAFISALQVYDIPWILSATDAKSAGGPGQVMLFPVMEMVRNVYSGDRSALGRASAEGVILMLVVVAVTCIQFKARKKNV
ncbi:MAG: sugar ABC transporter permease [Spirochaetaceae bacterium]|nr:sugar ABC transporter permease [Spirochaetaceae bacterium]